MKSEQCLEVFRKWYASLPQYKQNNGPAKGTIAASLVVLDRLKEKYDLSLEAHLAPKKTQIKGASGKAVAKILESFGELRPFAKEGGRTNRGGMYAIAQLLECLKPLELENESGDFRNEILVDFQGFLVQRVKDYHNRQKIKLIYNPNFSTWQNIYNLLEEASKENKGGYLAQHLVGAKLQLRFPSIKVSNESTTTADDQTNRQGDFQIEDTVFHVTLSPMQGVFIKCRENLENGLKVYLLVPDSKLAAARQLAGETSEGRIAVESLESFVSQNLDEISFFKNKQLATSIKRLIDIYNQRVDEVEIDKSLMIEIPSNLSLKDA